MGQRRNPALHTQNTVLHLNHCCWPKNIDPQALKLDPNFVLQLCWKQAAIWMPFKYENSFCWRSAKISLFLSWKCLVLYIALEGRKSVFRSQGKHNIRFFSVIWSLSLPFHVSSLPFPTSGFSPPYTDQVMEVNEIREGLCPPLMLPGPCPSALLCWQLWCFVRGCSAKKSCTAALKFSVQFTFGSQRCWSQSSTWTSLRSQSTSNPGAPPCPQGKKHMLKSMWEEQFIPHLLLLGTSPVGNSRSEYWWGVCVWRGTPLRSAASPY